MTPIEICHVVQTLRAQGHSLREISRLLTLSRNTVRRILRAGASPSAQRALSEQLLAQVRAAFERARGNAVRAQQLLAQEQGSELAYSTLTRWVRLAGLRAPVQRSGQYHQALGAEMQHDTSPHRISIGTKTLTAQCAGLVLACSRRLFAQYYPRFTRFEAKHFLLEAARFMDGVCPTCVIDNTSVMVASGAGPEAIIAPEMAAFARALGFSFLAHRVGHPDRKGRIERPFAYIETNFLPARQFSDFEDLNHQLLLWCREVANHTPKRALGMSAEAAYLIEKPYLKPLPSVLPPVYDVLERVVDLYGYVSVDTCRYSVPERLVGQSVSVYKHPAEIHVLHRGICIASHPRLIGQRDAKHTAPGHHQIPERAPRAPGLEAQLRRDYPQLDAYARALKQRGHGRGVRALKRLVELQRTYPRPAFEAAVKQAAHYGLYDLGRLEKLILQKVAGEFFSLHPEVDNDA
jgi:transposase